MVRLVDCFKFPETSLFFFFASIHPSNHYLYGLPVTCWAMVKVSSADALSSPTCIKESQTQTVVFSLLFLYLFLNTFWCQRIIILKQGNSCSVLKTPKKTNIYSHYSTTRWQCGHTSETKRPLRKWRTWTWVAPQWGESLSPQVCRLNVNFKLLINLVLKAQIDFHSINIVSNRIRLPLKAVQSPRPPNKHSHHLP